MDQVEISEVEHAHLLAERPRLLRDIVVVPLDTGVLIDGLGHHEVIQGLLAQTILPELLSLLDGTRTLPDLENAFHTIPPDYVRTAIVTLKKWGMLEHADDQSGSYAKNPDTQSFFRRQIAVAGLDQSAHSAFSCLENTKVVVAATNDSRSYAEKLVQQLQRTGIGWVNLFAIGEFSAAAIARNSLVVALAISGEDLRWYEYLEEQKNRLPFSWLHAVINLPMSQADIGPLFRPGSDSCYSCFRNTHLASCNSKFSGLLTSYEGSIWASFTALEVIHAIALPNLGISGRQFRRFDLPSWESRSLSYPRLPGCPHCQRQPLLAIHSVAGNSPAESTTDTSLIFEEYVGLESRTAMTSGAKRNFSQMAVLEEDGDRLPDCRQLPLYRGALKLDMDAFDAMRIDKKARSTTVTLEKLAAICAITGGIREISDKALRRWAATAGNLGSVELYIVSRAVDGLAEGFYYYDARKHTLALLRKEAKPGVYEFMCRVLGRVADDLPEALIVLSGSFARLCKKYGSFAYRLINFDAGAALSQLHLVARSMRLGARTALSMADDLIQEQFNLACGSEQPTAIVEVSSAVRKEKRPKKMALQGPMSSRFPRSWKTGREFAGIDLTKITEMLLDESRVLELEPRSYDLEVAVHLLAKDRGKLSIVKLPKAARKGSTVEDILARRRSIREYSSRPVEVGTIGTALHCASSTDTSVWPEESYQGTALTFFVLIMRASGIEPGVYVYDAERHGLSRLRPGLSREEMVELFVQSDFADAPAVIWIAGNLAAACASDGARGHRHLLLRAGAAAHRLWMAALASGLNGSIVAGLVPGAARRLLGFDGYKTASLLAFAAGHRREDPTNLALNGHP
jgi:SagB-type dehydrogenase family enzyme